MSNTPDWKPTAPAPDAALTDSATSAQGSAPPSGSDAAVARPAAAAPASGRAAATPATEAAPAPDVEVPLTPAGERLSIDEFMKIELRVAKVLTAERVPKSKKLVKLWIDLGYEQRTVVAGIAEAYEPDQLVGRTIVIVANLKPAKLMGIDSNGMILAASGDDGRPLLLSVDEGAVPGMKVK